MGSINLIEVINMVGVPSFPAVLPPAFAVCIVIGGKPGTVYSTKWRLIGTDMDAIGEVRTPDIPFTTEIKRANIFINFQQISTEPILRGPGTYKFQFLVNDSVVGETDLEVAALPGQRMPNG
jgi:hypothetical protein